MKVKKLDRRMKGYGDFSRRVDFFHKDVEQFIAVRKWCWEQWGPSCEIEFYRQQSNKNPSWAWLVDQWRIRIYLATDKEAQWFHLRWN